ncbi:hypothetical protein [Bacillus sp. SM2101]|uniref:hypothetical protein n=1 Tax=Bacillus sp. SM2101 TaxID=2805366 RepID=UPI001BDDDF5C|nr:hypothetical protein [Bacillus sp. SM2101]
MVLFYGKYKMSFAVVIVIMLLLVSFRFTTVPTSGFLSVDDHESPSFKVGVIRSSDQSLNMDEHMEQLKEVSVIAGADRVITNATKKEHSSFFPIYDELSTVKSFNDKYSYLPYDMTGKYGRTVYAINYGDTKMIFLRGDELRMDESQQLTWLNSEVKASNQMHHIVFIHNIPRDVSFWDSINDLDIHLVITENKLFTRKSVVMQEPSAWNDAYETQWAVWELNTNPRIMYLMLEMSSSEITVKALNQQGESVDRMIYDVAYKQLDLVHKHTAVPIQAMWKYHEGTDEISSFIHDGYDISGETPITNRYQVPVEDWRSKMYDDSSWKIGYGPFGYMAEPIHMKINQQLPPIQHSVTYFFRKTFDFDEDLEQLKKLFLHITFEDGYVAYLNGEEISRDGMKTGLVTHQTLAQPNETHLYETKDISNHSNKLIVGENVLSVEVHSSHPKASNFIFDLSFTYELDNIIGE